MNPQSSPDTLGVNVLGLFRYTSGLQQAALSLVDSLNRVGVETACRDVPVDSPHRNITGGLYECNEQFDVTIINTGIDTHIRDMYRKVGWPMRPNTYRIGVFWWELEHVPAALRDRLNAVDEIWAPTRFIADAFRAVTDKPVFTMLPGVELPPFTPLSKSHFGLADDRFTFGYVFDMNSRMQRKNPLGLIEAFRRGFGPSDRVQLALKVCPQDGAFVDLWSQLRAAIDATPNVVLVDKVFTREETIGFINSVDCYVSLHRSEGFGLTCAEAMLLGKPVIATGYSGNTDYMTAENSYLVRHEPVRLNRDLPPYPRGAVWAGPSLDHAAELMQHVYTNQQQATEKGRVARDEVSQVLSMESAGHRMRERLDQVRSAGTKADLATASV